MENNEVVQLYLDDIIPNRFQPREVFDDQALKELAISIREHGVIQPILVRKFGEKYEIIAGERRYKASTMAGLTKIPAIVKNLDDKESSKVALIENLQRRDLTPIEEARTYQKILDLDEMTQEQLAMTMGKSQSAVSNKLRLLSLPDEIQESLLKEEISERHARSLLNVEDKNVQIDLLKEIVNNKMTVRELDARIKKLNGEDDSNPTDVSGGVSNNLFNDVKKDELNSSPLTGVGVDTNTEKLFEDGVGSANVTNNSLFSNAFNTANNMESLFVSREMPESNVVSGNSNSLFGNVANVNTNNVNDVVNNVGNSMASLFENQANDTSILKTDVMNNTSTESLFESNNLFSNSDSNQNPVVDNGMLADSSVTTSTVEANNTNAVDSLFSTPSVDVLGNNNQNAVNNDNVIAANNIQVVVNDVKDVIKSYQEKGYSINLMELDLDREIQLVIKINKN